MPAKWDVNWIKLVMGLFANGTANDAWGILTETV